MDLEGIFFPGAREDHTVFLRDAVVEGVFVCGVGVGREGYRVQGGIGFKGEVSFCAVVHSADAGVAVSRRTVEHQLFPAEGIGLQGCEGVFVADEGLYVIDALQGGGWSAVAVLFHCGNVTIDKAEQSVGDEQAFKDADDPEPGPLFWCGWLGMGETGFFVAEKGVEELSGVFRQEVEGHNDHGGGQEFYGYVEAIIHSHDIGADRERDEGAEGGCSAKEQQESGGYLGEAGEIIIPPRIAHEGPGEAHG